MSAESRPAKRARAAVSYVVPPAEALYMYATQYMEVCHMHVVRLPMHKLHRLSDTIALGDRTGDSARVADVAEALPSIIQTLGYPDDTTCYSYGTAYTMMLSALASGIAIGSEHNEWARVMQPSVFLDKHKGRHALHDLFEHIGSVRVGGASAYRAALEDACAIILCGEGEFDTEPEGSSGAWHDVRVPCAWAQACTAVHDTRDVCTHAAHASPALGVGPTVELVLRTFARIPAARRMPGALAIDIALSLQLLVWRISNVVADSYAFINARGAHIPLDVYTGCRTLAYDPSTGTLLHEFVSTVRAHADAPSIYHDTGTEGMRRIMKHTLLDAADIVDIISSMQ